MKHKKHLHCHRNAFGMNLLLKKTAIPPLGAVFLSSLAGRCSDQGFSPIVFLCFVFVNSEKCCALFYLTQGCQVQLPFSIHSEHNFLIDIAVSRPRHAHVKPVTLDHNTRLKVHFCFLFVFIQCINNVTASNHFAGQLMVRFLAALQCSPTKRIRLKITPSERVR